MPAMVFSTAAGMASAFTAPASTTGISARRNGRSLLRKVARPLAGTLAEQPLRLAVTPAVARNAEPNRPTLSRPRRDRPAPGRVVSVIRVLTKAD